MRLYNFVRLSTILRGQVFFVNGTDGQNFYFTNFFYTTSAPVEKLAAYVSTGALAVEKIGKVAYSDENNFICQRKTCH